MRRFAKRAFAVSAGLTFVLAVTGCGSVSGGSVGINSDGEVVASAPSINVDNEALAKAAAVKAAEQLGYQVDPNTIERDAATGNYFFTTPVEGCSVRVNASTLTVDKIGDTTSPTEAQLGLTLTPATRLTDIKAQLGKESVRKELGC